MSLVPYTITALQENFADSQSTGKNTLVGAVVTMTDRFDAVVTMFDDENGLNPSTAKATTANGQVTVFVNEGEYNLSVNGSITKIDVIRSGVGTTLDLIASTRVYLTNELVETSGYTSSGDGGGAYWIKNGVTGQTPSQSPAQLASALLNDANGDQWEHAKRNTNVNVKAMGAIGDGVVDDSAAVQAAVFGLFVDYIGLPVPSTYGNRVVMGIMKYTHFPVGIYRIVTPIDVASRLYISGDNSMIYNDVAGGVIPAFRSLDGDWANVAGWVGQVKNIAISGNAFQLTSRPYSLTGVTNLDQGKLKFRNVTFVNADLALEYDLQSMLVTFEFCKWDNCKTHIKQYACDMLVIDNCWMSNREDALTVDGEAFFYLNGTAAVVKNCIFVPLPQTEAGLEEIAWFSNKPMTTPLLVGDPPAPLQRAGVARMEFSSNRFGAETGSCALMNWHEDIVLGGDGSPASQLVMRDNMASSAFGGSENATLANLFELPNSIIIENNTGVINQGYLVKVSNTVTDYAAFYARLNLAILSKYGREWLSYSAKDNATQTFYNYDMIDATLRPLFSSDLQKEVNIPLVVGTEDSPFYPLTTQNGNVALRYNVDLWGVNLTDNNLTSAGGQQAAHAARVNVCTSQFSGNSLYKQNQEFLINVACDFVGASPPSFLGYATEVMGDAVLSGTKLSIDDVWLEYSNGTIVLQEEASDIPAGVRLTHVILETNRASGFDIKLKNFSAARV